jgi:hypothetical protein
VLFSRANPRCQGVLRTGVDVRLTRDQIDAITQNVVHALIREGTISTEEPGAITDRLAEVITEDLAVEDRLNLEVRGIMEKYSDEITRGDINYQEMFRKIKAKLARERNIIL